MKKSKAKASSALHISDSNLSHAWGRVLLHATDPTMRDITPLIVTIEGLDATGMPREDKEIRNALDAFLKKHDEWSVDVVAFTIFPQSYLEIAKGDRKKLYEIYNDAFEHLRAANRANSHGLYFERLIAFGRGSLNENQLENIIKEYNAGSRRRSLFQAVVYDPGRDQTRQPYLPFPCLQGISFVPSPEGLVMNAIYPMQYLITRGYGNFLGLTQLGAFMAAQMKLKFLQLNVVAGVETVDFSKKDLESLIDVVRSKIEKE